MFDGHLLCALVMSPFFHSHEPYNDITLNDMCTPFYLTIYYIDGESDSDTCLTPTYFVESDPSKPSYPSVICLTSDSFSSNVGEAPPRAVDEESFTPKPCFVDIGEPVEEDMEMTHLEVLEMDLFCSENEDGLDSTCRAWT